jgi:hypothetical protein
MHHSFRRSAAQRSRQAPYAAARNHDGLFHHFIVPLLQRKYSISARFHADHPLF